VRLEHVVTEATGLQFLLGDDPGDVGDELLAPDGALACALVVRARRVEPARRDVEQPVPPLLRPADEVHDRVDREVVGELGDRVEFPLRHELHGQGLGTLVDGGGQRAKRPRGQPLGEELALLGVRGRVLAD
jgi:hypothetical protein